MNQLLEQETLSIIVKKMKDNLGTENPTFLENVQQK